MPAHAGNPDYTISLVILAGEKLQNCHSTYVMPRLRKLGALSPVHYILCLNNVDRYKIFTLSVPAEYQVCTVHDVYLKQT